jgi:alkylresorcinol/alkylpyrone synthase
VIAPKVPLPPLDAPVATPARARATVRPAPPTLAALATALPPHVIEQHEARAFAARLFGATFEAESDRLLAVFDHAGIARRHVARPLAWYGEKRTFAESNAAWLDCGLALASRAARDALARAGLAAGDVDHVVCVSSTGLATPSLEAHLANLLSFRPDVKRTPVWGLGCAGGAAGLARARDFALADPNARVLLVCLELCTLTFQHGDRTRRNWVAASLFSDGCAAAIVCGADAPAPGGGAALELLASHSTLWPDTLDVMGWDVDGDGLHVVFSRDIPSLVRARVRPDLERFLAANGLDLTRLDHLLAHPGGPRVMAAYADALGLPASALRRSREVLKSCGNMSSPTCLFVVERALAAGDMAPGQHAVVAALGPGFASELVLLRAAS